MYILVVTWLTLTPPYGESKELFIYKDRDQCLWAKQWVSEHNDLHKTWNLECIPYEN